MTGVIADNVDRVRQRIEAARTRAGRRDEVRLVAVVKGVGVVAVQAAVDAGITDLGENRVQEARERMPEVAGPVSWHFIGHLQRNKVRYVVDSFSLIHSVDSFRLAEQVDEEAGRRDLTADVLVQVNVSGEDSKFGVPVADARALLEEIAGLERVRVCGLMTMPPWSEDPEQSRRWFCRLVELRESLSGIVPGELAELSMGMTDDFEVAIEEGATIVRVGRAIFGERGD